MHILLITASATDGSGLAAALRDTPWLAPPNRLSRASAPDGLATLRALRCDVVLLHAPGLGQPWPALAARLHTASPHSAVLVIAEPADDAAAAQALAQGLIQDVLSAAQFAGNGSGAGAPDMPALARVIGFALARQRALQDARQTAQQAEQLPNQQIERPAAPPPTTSDTTDSSCASDTSDAHEAAAAPGRWGAQLRAVIDAAGDALLFIDVRSGHCSQTNRAFERIFAMPAASVLRHGLACLQSSRRMHSTEQLLQFIGDQMAATDPADPGARQPAQWVFRRGDSDEVWCELRAFALQGAPAHELLLSVHDLSDRVVAAQANKRAYALSARAARVRRQFLANMSHEMRTPLNAILNFARLGQEQAPPSPFDRYLGQIRSSAMLMLALVNDVLDLSKIESGKLELSLSAFELRQVVDQLVESIRPGAQAKGLTVQVQIAEGLAPHWIGDWLRIQQVLLNLLSNAVKFSRDGPIRLDLRPGRDGRDRPGDAVGLELVVSDSGIGMSQQHQERLFRPFEQGDSSAQVDGTGLGLVIAKNLVDAMGGQIEVQSAPQRGTQISVLLPLPALALPPGAAQGVKLRLLGLNAGERLACLLALGRLGLVAEVLGAGHTLEADALLVHLASVRTQPGGLAAALSNIAPGSVIAVLGAGDEDVGAGLPSTAQIVRLPTGGDERYNALAAALLARRSRLSAGPAPSMDGLRVLVAEDNLVNQMITEELLKSRGCQVSLVDDGAMAVQQLLATPGEPFDLILMDIQMPVLDGYAATRRLRAAGITLPIIALSAHVFDEDREAARQAGMNAYITKPLDIDQLAAVIAGLQLARQRG